MWLLPQPFLVFYAKVAWIYSKRENLTICWPLAFIHDLYEVMIATTNWGTIKNGRSEYGILRDGRIWLNFTNNG